MSLNDPFRNYDAWLTTDRMADEAEAAYERLMEAWYEYAEAHNVPVDAADDDYMWNDGDVRAREVYETWLKAHDAVSAYHDAKLAEQEAEYYEEEQRAHAEWEAKHGPIPW